MHCERLTTFDAKILICNNVCLVVVVVLSSERITSLRQYIFSIHHKSMDRRREKNKPK